MIPACMCRWPWPCWGWPSASGLTASSIAIMGAVKAENGGAAGSLEATGYELGTGLGITFFGVFMTSSFSRAIELPARLSPELAAEAAPQHRGHLYRRRKAGR